AIAILVPFGFCLLAVRGCFGFMRMGEGGAPQMSAEVTVGEGGAGPNRLFEGTKFEVMLDKMQGANEVRDSVVLKNVGIKNRINLEPAENEPQVRVRELFPETLLWRPEVITDDGGHASLDIELADSITTWRLSASAVTADGRLGAAQSSIRVFQPFFVD